MSQESIEVLIGDKWLSVGEYSRLYTFYDLGIGCAIPVVGGRPKRLKVRVKERGEWRDASKEQGVYEVEDIEYMLTARKEGVEEYNREDLKGMRVQSKGGLQWLLGGWYKSYVDEVDFRGSEVELNLSLVIVLGLCKSAKYIYVDKGVVLGLPEVKEEERLILNNVELEGLPIFNLQVFLFVEDEGVYEIQVTYAKVVTLKKVR